MKSFNQQKKKKLNICLLYRSKSFIMEILFAIAILGTSFATIL